MVIHQLNHIHSQSEYDEAHVWIHSWYSLEYYPEVQMDGLNKTNLIEAT